MIMEFWKGAATWFIWILFGSGQFSLTVGEERSEDLNQRPNSYLPPFPQQWQPKVKMVLKSSTTHCEVSFALFCFFLDIEFYIPEHNSLRVSFSQSRSFETTETLSFPVYFFHSLPSSTIQS